MCVECFGILTYRVLRFRVPLVGSSVDEGVYIDIYIYICIFIYINIYIYIYIDDHSVVGRDRNREMHSLDAIA